MPDRHEYAPEDLPPRGAYKLMTATVVPRPIAWVSTVSADGVANLAPHSFFTVACADPPVVQFVSVGRKDTLNNVEATGDFVVNLAGVPLYDQVNGTSGDYPADRSEFAEYGLTPAPSARVRSPRLLESPVNIECTLHSTVTLGDSTVVFGDVVLFSIADEVLDLSRPDRPHPRIEALQPLSRLGKEEWGILGEIRSTPRPRYDDRTGRAYVDGRPVGTPTAASALDGDDGAS